MSRENLFETSFLVVSGKLWMVANNVRTKAVLRQNNAWNSQGNGRKTVDWPKVCCFASVTTPIDSSGDSNTVCSNCKWFWMKKNMADVESIHWRSTLHDALLVSKEEVGDALALLEERKMKAQKSAQNAMQFQHAGGATATATNVCNVCVCCFCEEGS